MTNTKALELAIQLSCFCNEMASCKECIFSIYEDINDVLECGIENKMPYEWSIQVTKLSKMEGDKDAGSN